MPWFSQTRGVNERPVRLLKHVTYHVELFAMSQKSKYLIVNQKGFGLVT